MTTREAIRPGGFIPRFHPRILGTATPVFPGFEFDISEPVADGAKPDAVWHRERAKEMLKKHPEIRALMGHTPGTAWWCLLFAGLQLGLALALVGQPWWLMLLVAYGIGGWINVNLFMLCHECNHGLVFKRPSWNRALYTLTAIPMLLPAHHTWWVEHHIHHSDLGAHKDFIKRRRSILLLTRFVTPMVVPFALVMLITQAIRSALGLIVYLAASLPRGRLRPGDLDLAILADQHLVSGYRRRDYDLWAVTFTITHLAAYAGIYWLAGWAPLLYLLASQMVMTGFLHPLIFGMILSNAHFHGHKCYQPTASYYGWVNKVTFNFGLHTEHHDLARIPWSRLPRVREIAPEFYDSLVTTPSYVRLALQFVFGSRAHFEQRFDNEEHRNQALLEGP
jgi:sphingolipid delta-4 desaturase